MFLLPIINYINRQIFHVESDGQFHSCLIPTVNFLVGQI